MAGAQVAHQVLAKLQRRLTSLTPPSPLREPPGEVSDDEGRAARTPCRQDPQRRPSPPRSGHVPVDVRIGQGPRLHLVGPDPRTSAAIRSTSSSRSVTPGKTRRLSAKQKGLYLALNLLVFPGVTDREEEVERIAALVRRVGADQVQARSLAMDPDVYWDVARERGGGGAALGIPALLRALRAARPGLVIGNFARGLSERGRAA